MRRFLTAAMTASLVLAPGCRPKAAQGPEWMHSIPAGSQVAFSAEARWILENKEFQGALARSPLAEQALDLFLNKARVSPHLETGHITFFVMGTPSLDPKKPEALTRAFLIRLSGFKNPQNLYLALAESFPMEGSLVVGGKELALHVILDFNQVHLRAVAEPGGATWIGDLSTLSALTAAASPPPRGSIARAAEWMNPKAPFQGFLMTESLLAQLPKDKLPADWAAELPQGLEALAWSIDPATDGKGAHRVELSVAGKPEGVKQTVPWLQRLVAISNSLDPQNKQAAELVQENDRAGIRCTLSQEQVNTLMNRLGQPALRLSPRLGPPRA
jgi:hypothetical protein